MNGRAWKEAATIALTMLVVFLLCASIGKAVVASMVIAGFVVLMFAIGIWTLWLEGSGGEGEPIPGWRGECGHRWDGPGGRAPVGEVHVCSLEPDHTGNHVCDCGALLGVPVDG